MAYTDEAVEARRWLNTAERADLEAAMIPALLGIGHALLAIAGELAKSNG
jgi:hypothetical protein